MKATVNFDIEVDDECPMFFCSNSCWAIALSPPEKDDQRLECFIYHKPLKIKLYENKTSKLLRTKECMKLEGLGKTRVNKRS